MSDLGGRRILLTRTEEGCRSWAAEVEARGGEPVSLPCIRIQPIDDVDTVARLRWALTLASWLALTSPRAARAVRPCLEDGLPPSVSVAAVGPATAKAAETEFGRVDLVAGGGTGRSLAQDLLERLRGDRPDGATVVTAAAADGRRDLERVLAPEGVRVVRVDVYRTTPMPPVSPRRDVAAEVDVALLASPSAVTGLRAQARIDPELDIVTIGPTTSAAVREAGLRVAAEARERSLEGMLEVIP